MVLRRVFLSVYDKTGLPEFAAGLVGLFPQVEILSTGGTARLLRELGHRVTEVSDYTGFPELFGGRVKTLHPRIFGGILYRRGSHDEEAARHQIQPVDLVAVNLYPFEAAWMKGASEAELIEQIDVGGPALLRAAAKNSEQVLVVCRPQDYRPLLAEMEEGEVSLQTRRRLRSLAFAHTATYDALIASALATEEFPEEMPLPARRIQVLRYGENPWQEGAAYRLPLHRGGVPHYRQLAGKELSYTNLLDLVAAWEAIQATAREGLTACAVVKHAAPCGMARGRDPLEVLERAWGCDPVSAFGSVVAFSGPLGPEVARALVRGRFVEVLAAPSFHPEALAILAQRSALRLLEIPPPQGPCPPGQLRYRVRIEEGLVLVQAPAAPAGTEPRVATRAPFPDELRELARFAETAAACLKSNACALAVRFPSGTLATVGLGGGQPSRVEAVRLALERARRCLGGDLSQCVMASDAFFPFPDSVELAASAGVRWIVQSGGSKKDPEVIEACDRHGVAMLLTGVRHFRH